MGEADTVPDIHDMMRQLADQLPTIAAGIEAAAGDWTRADFVGTADDGGIVATVNGLGLLTNLEIGVMSKRRLDNLTLGECLVEAIKNAEAEAERQKYAMLDGIRFGDLSMGELMRAGPAAATTMAERAAFGNAG
jgi:DNA-binding protein YbaB